MILHKAYVTKKVSANSREKDAPQLMKGLPLDKLIIN